MNNKQKKSMTKKIVHILFILILAAVQFHCQSQEENSIKNIETFARLYGYVRFFHPSDEATKLDWNRFAIYGVKQVVAARNPQELEQTLEALFLPIAPSLIIHRRGEEPSFDPSSLIPKETSGLKIIAWQHRGVKFKNSPHVFNSIRLNRKNIIRTGYGFGNLFQSYQAKPYRNKDFLFKAAVKIESGQPHLWFREERLGNKPGLYGNITILPHSPIPRQQNNDPKESGTAWNTYELKGRIAPDAKNITFGCYLQGSGKVFTDHMQLQVKENGRWQTALVINPSFEGDEENTAPNFWWTRGEGYTFRVTSQTAAQGNKSVQIESSTITGPARLFEQYPAMGEYIQKDLGNGLACILPLALYGTEYSTFPSPPPKALEYLMAALSKEVSPHPRAASLYVRWADVVITWNVLHHFYPYFDLIKVNWEKQLTLSLKRARTDSNESDFLDSLHTLLAPLGDANAGVYHPLVKNRSGLPFNVSEAENRAVITASRDKHFQRGDIIVSIDGVNIKKVLRDKEKSISGSPRWKRFQALAHLGFGPEGSTATIKIIRNNRTKEINTTRNFKGRIKEFIRKPIWELKKKLYYVDLEQVTIKEFQSYLPQLADARGIIFDARGYIAYEKRHLLGYLADEPVHPPIWQFPEIIYPDQENVQYQSITGEISPRSPKIKGKCVFLIHNGTINASETFISIVRHYRLGTILGQISAGANGNINSLNLPGQYIIFWTGMRTLNQDRSQHHLLGIKPDIPVKRTISGIKQGKDEFLEKALAIILHTNQSPNGHQSNL